CPRGGSGERSEAVNVGGGQVFPGRSDVPANVEAGPVEHRRGRRISRRLHRHVGRDCCCAERSQRYCSKKNSSHGSAPVNAYNQSWLILVLWLKIERQIRSPDKFSA